MIHSETNLYNKTKNGKASNGRNKQQAHPNYFINDLSDCLTSHRIEGALNARAMSDLAGNSRLHKSY